MDKIPYDSRWSPLNESEDVLGNKIGDTFYIGGYKLTQVTQDTQLIENCEIKHCKAIICEGDFESILSGMVAVAVENTKVTPQKKLEEFYQWMEDINKT